MIAVLWHWWISVFLTLGTIGLLLATIAGYLTKVVSPKYAKKKK